MLTAKCQYKYKRAAYFCAIYTQACDPKTTKDKSLSSQSAGSGPGDVVKRTWFGWPHMSFVNMPKTISHTIALHLTISQVYPAMSSQLRHVSTIRKNLLNSNSNISSIYPHNMANVGPLMTEILSWVWGTLANFNGFRVLTSLLQRRRSPEANRTLHDLWQSPGLVH